MNLGGLKLSSMWTIAILQPVECNLGSELDYETMTCQKCSFPRTSQGGRASCSQCLLGYFMNDGACQICPDGATCDGLSNVRNLLVDSGHWRIDDQSDVLYECPLTGACVGGTNVNTSESGYCAKGYLGPLCAVCDENGYFFDTGSKTCSACEESTSLGKTLKATSVTVKFIAALFALVTLAYLGGLVWNRRSSGSELEKKKRAKEMERFNKIMKVIQVKVKT